MTDVTRIRNMQDWERVELRRFCLARLQNPDQRESAKATLEALDAYDEEQRLAERERRRAEATRIASLNGEARMIEEFHAARRSREEAVKRARERLTRDYVVSKLLESAAVVLAMPVGWFLGELVLGTLAG